MKKVLSVLFLIAILSSMLAFSSCYSEPFPHPIESESSKQSEDKSDSENIALSETEETTSSDDDEKIQDTTEKEEIHVSPEEIKESTINSLISSMTTEEKIGQMILARCPQTGGAELLQTYPFGGYVLFAANFEGKGSVTMAAETASYQAASKIPMLIAADEEGGTVTRISRFEAFRDSRFKSPRELFAEGGIDLLKRDTTEKSQLMLSLGVNLNLAPVCDIAPNEDDFMYWRSPGNDAQTVSECVSAIVSVMTDEGLGSCLKHFPGYGSNGDTHTDIIVDDRPYDTFVSSDFLPFKAAIEAGAGAVMVSHNIMTCVDSEYPSSISPAVHDVLRSKLAFDGVIITDDLIMDGIMKYTGSSGEAAVLAVLAGNDMLCSSDYEVQYNALLDAVQTGRISLDQIEKSVYRILEWKHNLGLIK